LQHVPQLQYLCVGALTDAADGAGLRAIAAELSYLPELKTLEFWDVNLRSGAKAIAAQLRHLPNLECLHLTFSMDVSGAAPIAAELHLLQHLRELKLLAPTFKTDAQQVVM